VARNYAESIHDNAISELSWEILKSAKTEISAPFQLLLSDSAERLYCHDIIRILPGKRLVAFGQWGNKEVVAKLFYERGQSKRHLKRDVLGVNALTHANVPVPCLLYQGSASQQRIQVLLFERVTQAINLEVIWQEQRNTDLFSALMHQVIVELATQHVSGILQHDLHFKNFLVTEKLIYTLDGGGIESFSGALSKAKSMDNLSLFFAQLGVGTQQLQCQLFKAYAKARGWLAKKADFDLLKELVDKKNKERWSHYQNKIIRTCSAFIRINLFNRLIVYDREYQSPALVDFFHEPEKLFTLPDIVFLKKGRSATLIKVIVEGRAWVVKRYNIKNSWHGLRRCLRLTRAEASWRFSQYLRLFGVPTAKPVAYIENRVFGLRGTSYFIMEYVEGKNLGEFFSSYDANEGEEFYVRKAALVVDLLNKLAELKMTHGDLKMTNILFSSGYPLLIDLDSMREHITQWGFKKAAKKDIQRFMENWRNHPKVAAIFNNLLSN
jgi:tRNA A-37 threonylcarbamoyl transferase component Bud32